MYRNGTCELHNKLQKRKKKGLLGSDANVEIQEEVSAIENYLAINKLSPNPRRIIPMSTAKQPFVSFTERQLAMFFFNRGGALRARVQELVGTVCTSMQDVEEWIGGKEPGFLIKHLIVDIDPEDLTSRQRGKAGHRAAIKLLSLDDLETHLQMLDDPEFRPETYARKGYFHRGSLRTDGFTMQLLCSKVRELLSVKYKRLPDDRLPPRLTSTLHGTSDFLTEIRNVVRTKDDVARLWPGVDPKDIKILTLDAGQAFVVGAYAHLPQSGKDKDPVQGAPPSFKGLFPITSSSTTTPQDVMQRFTLEQQATTTPPTMMGLAKAHHHNLAVNQSGDAACVPIQTVT
ncbi:hypothetical protein BC939DRAFT_172096 [Gamsiella multidivaricata]|uniref:uncharacterized protein n=1 Tax=Gamsiella multidivaricata TaxID=101098 RepID=UPI00221EFB4E|nr:uncharacterized protein BC939DRAFT_172096 [Gamsiella multidivaricata]KAI7822851.1 hypothetical protein BC939DRAFT_172096 [Gamsiella multidivaricata]